MKLGLAIAVFGLSLPAFTQSEYAGPAILSRGEAPSAMAGENVVNDRTRLGQGDTAISNDGCRALRVQSLIGWRRRPVWIAWIGLVYLPAPPKIQ